VKRTRHRVALDVALGQISTHVPTVGIKDMRVTGIVGEHHQFGAECLDLVWLSVGEPRDEPQAVPAAGEPLHGGTGVDLANLVDVRHAAPLLLLD